MPTFKTPHTGFKVRKLAFMVGSVLAVFQAYF